MEEGTTKILKSIFFKEEKTNMPSKYSVPEGQKISLSAIKSEIQDPRNRNNVLSNLPIGRLESTLFLLRGSWISDLMALKDIFCPSGTEYLLGMLVFSSLKNMLFKIFVVPSSMMKFMPNYRS